MLVGGECQMFNPVLRNQRDLQMGACMQLEEGILQISAEAVIDR